MRTDEARKIEIRDVTPDDNRKNRNRFFEINRGDLQDEDDRKIMFREIVEWQLLST